MAIQGALRPFRADLHVHTVLSPCASYRMAPGRIVARALEVGLDIVAIADHNSAANVRAVVEAARGTGLRVLPGMEVESREEVHVLSLFEEVEQAEAWQEVVYAHLPDLPNDEAAFGAQLVVSADDGYIRHEGRRLLVATFLGLDELVERVVGLGGVVIPAHVDRPAYGLVGVLGFVPPGPDFLALEVSRHAGLAKYVAPGRACIRSSDAHDLGEVGRATTVFHLASPTLAELRLACRGEAGRWVEVR